MKKTVRSLLAISSFVLLWLQVFAAQTTSLIRVTLDPSPVACIGIAPQECLVMTIQGETKSQLLYEDIHWFEFKKGNTYVLDLKKIIDSDNMIADKSSITYELVKEVSRNFDAKVCTAQSYSDWCNTCMGTGDTAACTLMYCAEPEVPSCAYDKPLKVSEEKPTMCTLQYDPVCSADGTEYGNACMAGVAGVKDASREYCKTTVPVAPITSHQDIITWAHENNLTMFSQWSQALVDQYTTREQAAKILVEFSKLYSPERPMTRMICTYNDTKNVSADLQNYLKASCNLRLLTGDKNNNFKPYEAITQQELRLILEDILSQDDKQYVGHAIRNKALLPTVSRGNMFTWLYEIYNLTQTNK